MPNGVTFGAIRWDAWWSLAAGAPALETRNVLSDPEFQFRAPIHAAQIGAQVLQYSCTQQKFDDEITFANSAGANFYWVYLLYANGDPMNVGLDFHMSSSIGSQQKYCLMMSTGAIGNTGNYQSIIDAFFSKYMTKSFYFKLPSGKPLLYLYYTATDIATYWGGNIANLKTAVDYLRSKITTGMGANPYVIVLCGADDVTRVGIGADAVSNYIAGFSRLLDGSYSQLDTSCQNYWAAMANAVSGSGGAVAPICMMGWAAMARKRRPQSWQRLTQIPEHGLRYKYAYPTSTEISNHVQAALSYIAAHPSVCPEKTIICYAWNECDEGGWLCKTIGDPTGSRLAAVASVIA